MTILNFTVLWSNPESGPAAVVVRFHEGYQEPWYYHTPTYHAVNIKGGFQTRSKEVNPTVSEVYESGA